jgi:outer membrane protein
MSLLRLLPALSCLAYLLLMAWGAQAKPFEKGDIILRGRAVAVLPDESGEFIPIGGSPYISDAILPEVDVSYFLTDNIAVEGILGFIPHRAKAENTSQGTRYGGWIYAVAPTVMMQYHIPVTEVVSPYLGLGMAYVKYFEDDKADQLQYEDDFAAVAQAGVNIHIDEKWHANIDIKRAWVGTEVKINGGEARGDVNIDPMIYGVGVGYRF